MLPNGFVFISWYHGCNRCLSRSQRQTQMDSNEKGRENGKASCILALKDAFLFSAAPTVWAIAPAARDGTGYVQFWNGRGAGKPMLRHPLSKALAVPKCCCCSMSVQNWMEAEGCAVFGGVCDGGGRLCCLWWGLWWRQKAVLSLVGFVTEAEGCAVFGGVWVAQQKYIIIANLTPSVARNKKCLGAAASHLDDAMLRLFETPFLPEGSHPCSQVPAVKAAPPPLHAPLSVMEEGTPMPKAAWG